MEKLTVVTGTGVPLRRSNVDTDQIIPAVFLKRVKKTGFEDALFYAWRRDPDFVLNRPEYKQGKILVAGPDFGIGSSREHAVYCLKYAGVPCVLAETCSRIYYRNAINNGYPVLFIKGLSEAIRKGSIKTGDTLEVDLDSGTVKDRTTGLTLHGDKVSSLEHDIMAAGGLFQYMKKTAGKA